MALIIINKELNRHKISIEKLKNIFKIVLNKKRGPSSVTSSLIRGLNLIKQDYILNPLLEEIREGDILFVNESINALKEIIGIADKKRVKIIAGPNLVVTPKDYNEIILNSHIDIILEPSLWTKEFLIKIEPQISNKIEIWPAGVNLPELNLNPINKESVILYIKEKIEKTILEKIKKICRIHKFKLVTLRYGEFSQDRYFNELKKSKILIYFGKSESQGIALQEAWANNVPTLVLKNETFCLNDTYIKDPKISSPYLTEETGLFFNLHNLEEIFNNAINDFETFNPRNYVEKNLSDSVCAQRFIKIVEKLYEENN